MRLNNEFETIFSLIDIASCKGEVTKAVVIDPNDPHIANKSITRTDVECLLRCQSENSICSGVFRDNKGTLLYRNRRKNSQRCL